MTSSHNASDTQTRTLRPKDAATLIVLRRMRDGYRVLMGRRHSGQAFMPGKFVFPGGRVDAADSRITPASDLRESEMQRLMLEMRGRPTPNRVRALALAAVRETFEETGLAIGTADGTPRTSRSAAWQAFYRTGVRPALSPLHYIARAITPPGRPRRFDARFFVVEEEHVAHGLDDEISPGTDELLDLRWFAFDEARAADLPRVTREVIGHLERILAQPGGLAGHYPVPFWFTRRGRWIRLEL